MNALPFAAQLLQVVRQSVFYLRNLAARESVIFPKFDRPSRTLQIEHPLHHRAPSHAHELADDRSGRQPTVIISDLPSAWVYRKSGSQIRIRVRPIGSLADLTL